MTEIREDLITDFEECETSFWFADSLFKFCSSFTNKQYYSKDSVFLTIETINETLQRIKEKENSHGLVLVDYRIILERADKISDIYFLTYNVNSDEFVNVRFSVACSSFFPSTAIFNSFGKIFFPIKNELGEFSYSDVRSDWFNPSNYPSIVKYGTQPHILTVSDWKVFGFDDILTYKIKRTMNITPGVDFEIHEFDACWCVPVGSKSYSEINDDVFKINKKIRFLGEDADANFAQFCFFFAKFIGKSRQLIKH